MKDKTAADGTLMVKATAREAVQTLPELVCDMIKDAVKKSD